MKFLTIFGAAIASLAPLVAWAQEGPSASDRVPNDVLSHGLGVCAGVNRLDLRHDADSEGRIRPGSYRFEVRSGAALDVELVGGGGSGGGTTLGTGFPKWGSGGQAGELKRWAGLKLEGGAFLLTVGSGGVPVTGSRDYHDWAVRPVPGNPGGETSIKRCTSGFRIVSASGGARGEGDASDIGYDRNKQRAGNGASLFDSENNRPLGQGGAGGSWQQRGDDGQPWGAGGGGEGGHTGPGTTSGQGGNGYARIIEVKNSEGYQK